MDWTLKSHQFRVYSCNSKYRSDGTGSAQHSIRGMLNILILTLTRNTSHWYLSYLSKCFFLIAPTLISRLGSSHILTHFMCFCCPLTHCDEAMILEWWGHDIREGWMTPFLILTKGLRLTKQNPHAWRVGGPSQGYFAGNIAVWSHSDTHLHDQWTTYKILPGMCLIAFLGDSLAHNCPTNTTTQVTWS